ncbi:ABC transporter permease [Amygdalobacter nucleatus]|uniref:ABC transporter, permease protein n=1 Tax=Amygdalobacter nucleatus TaxID=3029274 RepID=A0A133YFR0_9FIRM|nr:iron ABC transporter permease [Amygdalobacter nucleatus]KXB42024.1 ABC transporter, permease protein [Amygdalobacter nucleatus]MDF0485681.1 iron ABC transporter permease [Amygdalobacter nucleatus]
MRSLIQSFKQSLKRSDLDKMEGRHFSLDLVLTWLSFILLLVIVVLPIAMIIINVFFNEGSFDLSMFKRVLLDKENIKAMFNTLIIALSVTVLGTVVGLFFAWLLGRSDIPLKGLMRSLFTIPYMFPPFFGAMAWDLLLSPRGGYFNNWYMSVTGAKNALFNINSLGGIIFVEMSYYFPFVFMQVVSALERMDPTLEESARIAGAKQGYVIAKITLPLVKPAIASGALLILTSSLSHFGVPSILGFSQKIYTLPTRIYDLINRSSGDFQGIREGAALSLLLVAVVMLALVLQKHVLKAGSYDIIKGKSMRPMLIKLRGSKWPLLFVALSFLVVVVVIPLAMIFLVGMLKAYGLPLTLNNFTLDNFKEILTSNKMVTDSISNSLLLSISAGIICMILGVIIAYVITKIQPRGKTVLEIISVLPYSIPGIVLAIGVILTWSGKLYFNLYNTLWIILVAYLARYLAFSMKSASASLQQVHHSLEDAARNCGASHFESLLDVTLPLIRPAMVSGFFLIFLPAMRELTTSVLLYGPFTRTLGVAIYSLKSDGYIVQASALASVAIIIIFICNAIVRFITKDRRSN